MSKTIKLKLKNSEYTELERLVAEQNGQQAEGVPRWTVELLVYDILATVMRLGHDLEDGRDAENDSPSP